MVEPLPAVERLTGLPHLQCLMLVDESFDGSREPTQLPAPADFAALQRYWFEATGGFQVRPRLHGCIPASLAAAAAGSVLQRIHEGMSLHPLIYCWRPP